MPPIRILHVFGSMGKGGAESRTMDIYRNIDREKIQFDFMVHLKQPGFYDNEIKIYGGVIYRTIPRYKVYNEIQYRQAWREFLNEHRYDFIHIHTTNTAVPILKEAKRAGVAVRICHARSASEDNILRRFLLRVNRKSLKKYSTCCLAVSDTAGRFVYGDKSKFLVPGNAIDAEMFLYNDAKRQLVRDQMGWNEAFVIGHIGRFHKAKNHMFLLQTFSLISSKISNAILVLAGDGSLRSKIEQRADSLGLNGRVVFLGIRDDIDDLLQAFDLLMFPSLFEGLPGVLIEAQAAGLPVFASDTITTEAMLIEESFKFLPINKGAGIWSDSVIQYANRPCARRDNFDKICGAGFDIHSVVKWYERLYLNKDCEET